MDRANSPDSSSLAVGVEVDAEPTGVGPNGGVGTVSGEVAAAAAHPRRWTIVSLGVLASVLCVVAAAAVAIRGTTGAPVSTDAFTGTGPALAGSTAVDGGRWGEVGGTFSLVDGQVRVEDRVPATRAIAVFSPESSPTVITAQLGDPVAGSGLVFRYVDSSNYWSLVARSDFATWNLNRTINGETLFVSNTGLGFSPENTRLEVRLDGTRIRFLRNGVVVEEVRSPVFEDARGVGLLASPADRGATTWVSMNVGTESTG